MCSAERACLRVLEGGCSVPVGVASKLEIGEGKNGLLVLTGCVTSLDGSQHVEQTMQGTVSTVEEAEELGVRLARLLVQNGAQGILDKIFKEREGRMIKD
jgi:hydroxymethylbilane synthase